MSNQDKLKVALKDFTWLGVKRITWVYSADPEPVGEDDEQLYMVQVSLTITLINGEWLDIASFTYCEDLEDIIGTLYGLDDYQVIGSSNKLEARLNLETIGEAMFEYMEEYAQAGNKNEGEQTVVEIW